MIYIDPPYNTGHDFVYRDKFSLTQKELEDEAFADDSARTNLQQAFNQFSPSTSIKVI